MTSEAVSHIGGLKTEFWDQVRSLAREHFSPTRIWLFGSRARGTWHSKSDVDLAFEFPPERARGFAAFCARMDDEALTLQELDLLDLSRCSETLRDEILRTGVLIDEAHLTS